MSEPFSKSGLCSQCKAKTVFILHRQIFTNGSNNFLWVCSRCNFRNPEKSKQFYIPSETVQKHLKPEQIDALPMILPKLYNRCARCGARDVELHHWAPVAKFGQDEAEQWPMDYLCKDCHDQRHRTVTPELVNGHV